ncbi:MAG: hypothetical protein ACRDTV_22680 [Mycobacterium sp.]
MEKIAENILEDLFTTVLDWPVANVKPQVERADIVLTRLGLKWLVLEVKRPGSLLGHRTAIEAALTQARRYAADQRVKAVAVSDATMLYGIGHGGGDIPPAGEVHPKYKLAMQCFAYVGGANDTHTWKLPYLLSDGITPDAKRLPKAIQCILSNYRGAQADIPEADVADVMVRLGIAAKMLAKMPCQNKARANAYQEAHRSLQQLDRLHDVGCCGNQ